MLTKPHNSSPDAALENHNLYSQFSQRFPADRQSSALETPDGTSISYAELDTRSAQMANFLTNLGLQQGDRVTAQIEKSPEGLYLYLGCIRAGYVFHPLNTAYQRAELDYFIGNAEPSVIICDDQFAAVIQSLATNHKVKHCFTLQADGQGTLMDASRDSAPEFKTVENTVDDLAALLYSSGTTGRPKGIELTHGNLVSNATTLVSLWGFTNKDVLLHALPIFHVHGLFIAIGCALMSGAKLLYQPKFDVRQVISALPRATVMMGVPTFYTRLLAEADFGEAHCQSMRLFISGSAPLLEETFEQFAGRSGHRILERYGMSETGMNTSNPLHGERKPGTVGPTLPDVSARVVNEAGVVLATGEVGDLQVKGPNVFRGYWRMPEKTADDFTDDGYFDTGDKACIDADGYVAIVGRAKDMVISGGLNIYPKEVELVMDELDGVLESAIIGVPHSDFGEAVVAVVVLSGNQAEKSQEDQIIASTRNELANYKVPKRVIFVDALPRNTMGKVQKAALRQQYASLFVE